MLMTIYWLLNIRFDTLFTSKVCILINEITFVWLKIHWILLNFSKQWGCLTRGAQLSSKYRPQEGTECAPHARHPRIVWKIQVFTCVQQKINNKNDKLFDILGLYYSTIFIPPLIHLPGWGIFPKSTYSLSSRLLISMNILLFSNTL